MALITFEEAGIAAFSLSALGVLVLASFFLKNARFNAHKAITLSLMWVSAIIITVRGYYQAYNEDLISNLVYYVGALCTVATSVLLVYSIYRNKLSKNLLNFSKLSAFIITTVLLSLLVITLIPTKFIEVRTVDGRLLEFYDLYIVTAVLLASMTVISIIVFLSGYFRDWYAGNDLSDDKPTLKRHSLDTSGGIAFALMFVLCSVCIVYMIYEGYAWHMLLMLTISAFSLLALLIYISISKYKSEPFPAVVSGIFCLAFCWVFLYSWLDQGVGTLIASVVGMALAFISIFVGFIFRVKALRLYGLVLTILMTVKAIAYDLSGSDGITRVISLLIGGIICFGIVVIYTRLESSLKQSDHEQE